MEIRLNEKDRKELWSEMTNIEFRTKELRGIFQNEIPITPEILRQFSKEKELIIDQLNNIENEVAIRVKAVLKNYLSNN